MKKYFPIFKNNPKLIYLDSAATSQIPNITINALKKYYSYYHSNVHKGIHTLSEKSTQLLEKTRKEIKKLLNARFEKECIFVKSTTEAINLLAYCLNEYLQLKKTDIILITVAEHHANFLPWKLLAERTECILKIVPVKKNGTINLKQLKKELNKNVKIFSITHVSNVLGIINPIEKIIKLTKQYNIITIIDGAQSIQHLQIDVQKINCDFFVFSSHKLYGPTGVGILYGKLNILEKLPPYQTGGNMILTIDDHDKFIYNEIPYKFEAGTPNIASIIAFAKSIYFIKKYKNKIINNEKNLLKYTLQNFKKIKTIKILGNNNYNEKNKVGIISFTHNKIHAHDFGTLLNSNGIAVRTGHLCCIPLLKYFKKTAVTRISLGLYNDIKDIKNFFSVLKKILQIFDKKNIKL